MRRINLHPAEFAFQPDRPGQRLRRIFHLRMQRRGADKDGKNQSGRKTANGGHALAGYRRYHE